VESTIAYRLRSHRLAAGLSQERLAAKAGISRSTIERIESGRSKPRAITCIHLANALGLTLEELIVRRFSPAYIDASVFQLRAELDSYGMAA
jgi:transcriptional regulator with XRE-family HTH domain